MALYRDPVEGLVQYVKDIKPYHTKLIDVVVTYTYEELINVNVLDELQTNITFDMDYAREPCLFGYDTDGYDLGAYTIPNFGYAINHANAYNVDCILTGCERFYKTTLLSPLVLNEIITLPFNYLYDIETLFVYVNGSLQHNVFEQVMNYAFHDITLDDNTRYNTNKIKCLHLLPVGTRLLISTHQVGVNNECWPELASSGYESHTFDEHAFDLPDYSFDKWPFGYSVSAIDTTPFDMPDPISKTLIDCKCPPFIPYASPTSILPSITEDIIISEMISFVDNINVSVYDWSANWINGFDLTPWGSFRFDPTSIWDIIDNEGYNFGLLGRPTLIDTNFTILDEYTSAIPVTIGDTLTQSERIDIVGGIPHSTTTATTIMEAVTMIEILEFSDIIGVNVVDPSSTNSLATMPNTENWFQFPTTGGFECDNLGFDVGEFDSDQSWSCIPCSLVGGFDDSNGFDEYYDNTSYDIPNINIPPALGYDYDPLWNSFPLLPYRNDGTDYIHGCVSNTLSDSIITIITQIGEDVTFIYHQLTPSTEWVITHNLNRYPIIRVFSESGVEIHPASVIHLSPNTAMITFSIPMTGIIRFV